MENQYYNVRSRAIPECYLMTDHTYTGMHLVLVGGDDGNVEKLGVKRREKMLHFDLVQNCTVGVSQEMAYQVWSLHGIALSMSTISPRE